MADFSGNVPLKTPRLIALSLAWAWGTIAGGTGLNALVKSNQEKSRLKHMVPPPTVLSINTNDLLHPGIVATVVSAFTAVLCSLYIYLLLLPKHSSFNIPTPLSTRTLRLQVFSLAFCALWILAVQIPYTQVFVNNSALVRASIGGVQLPPAVVQQTEKALGATSRYKDIYYLKLTAILPWVTIAFTVAAAVVSFLAISRARDYQPPVHKTSSTPDDPEKEQHEHITHRGTV